MTSHSQGHVQWLSELVLQHQAHCLAGRHLLYHGQEHGNLLLRQRVGSLCMRSPHGSRAW